MNSSERMYSKRIIPSVNIDGQPEWYCLVREGMLGPYDSEDAAHQAIRDFIAWCIEVGTTGNRNEDTPSKAYLKHPDTMRWIAAGVVDKEKL